MDDVEGKERREKQSSNIDPSSRGLLPTGAATGSQVAKRIAKEESDEALHEARRKKRHSASFSNSGSGTRQPGSDSGSAARRAKQTRTGADASHGASASSSLPINTLITCADDCEVSLQLIAPLFVVHTTTASAKRFMVGIADAVVFCLNLSPSGTKEDESKSGATVSTMISVQSSSSSPAPSSSSEMQTENAAMQQPRLTPPRSGSARAASTLLPRLRLSSAELHEHIRNSRHLHAVALSSIKRCLTKHRIHFDETEIYGDLRAQLIPAPVGQDDSMIRALDSGAGGGRGTLPDAGINIGELDGDAVWYSVSHQDSLLVRPLAHPSLGQGFRVSVCIAPPPSTATNVMGPPSPMSVSSPTGSSTPTRGANVDDLQTRVYRKRKKPMEYVGELLDRIEEYQSMRRKMGSKNLACAALGWSKATINSYASMIRSAEEKGMNLEKMRMVRFRDFKAQLDGEMVEGDAKADETLSKEQTAASTTEPVGAANLDGAGMTASQQTQFESGQPRGSSGSNFALPAGYGYARPSEGRGIEGGDTNTSMAQRHHALPPTSIADPLGHQAYASALAAAAQPHGYFAPAGAQRFSTSSTGLGTSLYSMLPPTMLPSARYPTHPAYLQQMQHPAFSPFVTGAQHTQQQRQPFSSPPLPQHAPSAQPPSSPSQSQQQQFPSQPQQQQRDQSSPLSGGGAGGGASH